HYGFGAFLLQKIYDMIVCQRRELYQDLSDDSYLGLLYIHTRKVVKVADNGPQVSGKSHDVRSLLGQGMDTAAAPFLMKGIGTARYLFIGSGGVYYTHEHIAVYHSLQSFDQKGQSDGKARIRLHAVGIDGDYGNLSHAGFFQGAADKADVIGGTAAAAGLAHKDGGVIQIIFSRKQRVHNLTDDNQGG